MFTSTMRNETLFVKIGAYYAQWNNNKNQKKKSIEEKGARLNCNALAIDEALNA